MGEDINSIVEMQGLIILTSGKIKKIMPNICILIKKKQALS